MAATSTSASVKSVLVDSFEDDSSLLINSWPGAETVFCADEWSSFVVNDEERASLIATNQRLRNQVEVLAALAGRPNSGLACTRAVHIQSAARRLSAQRALRKARLAVLCMQRAARGRRQRASFRRVISAAVAVQARQRARLVTSAVRAATCRRAAARLQRAFRAYQALLQRTSKTRLRRELLNAQLQVANLHTTLGNVVAAHSAAASRARHAEARALQQEAEAEERREASAREKQQLRDEIDELVAQVAAYGSENAQLQEQASELLAEKLQGWV